MLCSARCDEQAAVAQRRRRQQGDDLQKRAGRVELWVALGELSSARQALEWKEVAAGTRETLWSLTNESKRPPRLRDPIPREILDHSLPVPFVLDPDKFLKNVVSARRGAAGGFSGMTVEHFRLVLDLVRDQQFFCKLAEKVARASITGADDGVAQNERRRGIVVGDVVRRLVARTIATVGATAPFQCAFSTRAAASVSHTLSRDCAKRTRIPPGQRCWTVLYARCGGKTLPFVRMFHGPPSRHIWEDGEGEEHTILQGEGGEQEDPLMLLSHSLGQHSALEATQEEFTEDECLLAYLNVVSPDPDRASHVYAILQRHLYSHTGSGQRDATCWRGLRRRRIWKLEFGGGEGLIYHQNDKESSCWARWGIRLSSKRIWNERLRNSARCWHGFHLWEIWSLRG